MYAYDYSEGFVQNMLEKAGAAGLNNLDGRQGDSHEQDKMYPGVKFDLIFGCNLIDRLHSPQLWVEQSKVFSYLNNFNSNGAYAHKAEFCSTNLTHPSIR